MEVNVELLLGTRVRDSNGEVVGRIEEIIAERGEDSCRVESYMIGASAVVERLSAWTLVRPIRKMLRARNVLSVFEVDWRDIDLSDPKRPVLRIPSSELHRAK